MTKRIDLILDLIKYVDNECSCYGGFDTNGNPCRDELHQVTNKLTALFARMEAVCEAAEALLHRHDHGPVSQAMLFENFDAAIRAMRAGEEGFPTKVPT